MRPEGVNGVEEDRQVWDGGADRRTRGRKVKMGQTDVQELQNSEMN